METAKKVAIGLAFVLQTSVGTVLGEPSFTEPRPWTSNVLPSYPVAWSATAEDEVTVRLAVVVDRDGSVRDPQILDGAEPFATAALKAVKRWHYEPARDQGLAIAVPREILVRFELPPRGRDRWHVFRRDKPRTTVVAEATLR